MSKKAPKLMKVVYFDEPTAQDYIDIVNGGRLDWNKEENKKRAAEILTELEAQAKGGFNIISFLKASLSGNFIGNISGEASKIFDTTLKNTLLTEYVSLANCDKNVKKFENDGVCAPKDSISMYKMFSTFLPVVPKEQLPIDLEKLNDAILGERGYYPMLLLSEKSPKSVLRFNNRAFRNNYNIADLSKMKLTFYGVKVGTCGMDELSIENEFNYDLNSFTPTAEEVVEGKKQDIKPLTVYDIILAGVFCE